MARRKRTASSMGVYHDFQRRTCLLVSKGDQVKFIPLDISDGFQVHETTMVSFEQRYTCMPDYPLDKAAQLYLNYALAVGATHEVVDYLSQIITVTEEDRTVATSKRSEKPAPKKKAVKAEIKSTRRKRVKKPEVEKKPVRKRSTRRTKKAESSTEYKSAAAMFQGLIMEGRLTDDEIFEQVQSTFGLDDKKRSYVTWYRNNLKKER